PYLLYFLRETRLRRLALMSFLLSVALFAIGLFWIRHVTFAGVVAVALILSVYVAAFAVVTKVIVGGLPGSTGRLFLAVPVVWCAAEYLRSISPLGGFPWFLLGHTQAAHLPIVQIVDLTGVCGVSFIIAMCNGLVAGLICDWHREGFLGALFFRKGLSRCFVFVVLITVVVNYGFLRMTGMKDIPGPVVAVVQGNIPQSLKEFGEPSSIFDKHLRLTASMLKDAEAKKRQIDLIVWSETMFPYAFGEDFPESEEVLSKLVEKTFKRPFLVGAITYERIGSKSLNGSGPGTAQGDSPKYENYNSAYLFMDDGSLAGRYDKIHLVPVGEYVPFMDTFPWLEKVVTEFSELSEAPTLRPGKEVRLFSIAARNTDPVGTPADGAQPSKTRWSFAVPICFESVFPNDVREMVRHGSDFIVNISNDGWFKDSAELEQCLYITAFRAIENRIGIVRATNTGISAFISPRGEVRMLQTARGVKEVEGTLIARVSLREGESFFTRHGELFGQACTGAAVLWFLGVIIARRVRPQSSP
ncbi:MAG: apolipoprotein N-acyltransferase, partial [Planctomycetota bacterium]|nr:apolipoprotein N-acyltransferase [Planctomycetota bacterium]